jgi:type IV pilus assembly protein PilV
LAGIWPPHITPEGRQWFSGPSFVEHRRNLRFSNNITAIPMLRNILLVAAILHRKKIWPRKVATDDTLNRHQRGFTLLECLVSLIVFFVVIMGLSSITVMVIKGNSFSQTMTVATALATDKIESLQNTGYDDVASGGPETLQSIYARQWTVTSNSPVVNTKTIDVTVSWSWLGFTRNVTLTTIITR